MTYYRFGQRIKMTRAVARAMARSSAGKRNSATIEKLVQTSKSRFGSAVRRVFEHSNDVLTLDFHC